MKALPTEVPAYLITGKVVHSSHLVVLLLQWKHPQLSVVDDRTTKLQLTIHLRCLVRASTL